MRSPISPAVVDDAIRGLRAMHDLGVMQGDSTASNILAHPDRPGIIWIDFERAEFIRPRVVLGSLPSNRKRNWSHEEGKHRKRTPLSEIRQAKTELTRLVGKGDCMIRSPNLGRGEFKRYQ